MFHLDRAAAQEFMEVYHTIIPEYNAIVEHYTSGPAIAMEIRAGRAQLDKVCWEPHVEMMCDAMRVLLHV